MCKGFEVERGREAGWRTGRMGGGRRRLGSGVWFSGGLLGFIEGYRSIVYNVVIY